MKKIITSTIICFVALVATGQQIIPGVPGFKNSFQGFHEGDKYVTRISNPHEVTVVFTPQYAGFAPGMFASRANYLAWLISHATSSDHEENKMNVFLAESRVMKSKFFSGIEDHIITMDTIVPERWDIYEIYAKSYSPIGGKLGLYSRKCWNTTMTTIFDLVSTGLFASEDFTMVNVTGINGEGHTIGQWKFRGSWIKFDNDASKRGGMHENLASPNGFSSVDDLFRDRNLISADHLWIDTDGDTVDMTPALPYSATNDYKNYFDDSTSKEILSFHTVPTLDVSGTIKLCPKCCIESSVVIPRYALLDSSFIIQHPGWRNFDTALVAAGSGQTTAAIDTIDRYMSIMLDTEVSVAGGIFDEGSILRQTKISQQNKVRYAWTDIANYYTNPEFVPQIIPLDVYIVPPHNDTLVVGRDLAYPGYVIKIASSSASCVGDTCTTGVGNFYLWSMSDETPVIPPSAYNYLQTGWLAPSDDTTWIWLTTNPVLKNNFEGYEFSTDDTNLVLDVEQTYNGLRINNSSTLPVTLSAFNAVAVANSYIQITWSTQIEVDNDKFEILRSIDAENFQKIGEVPGHGSSSIESNYRFDDRDVTPGIYYYRLKQVDNDGDSEIFPQTRSVKIYATDKIVSTNFFNIIGEEVGEQATGQIIVVRKKYESGLVTTKRVIK